MLAIVLFVVLIGASDSFVQEEWRTLFNGKNFV
jgi:hypothetical protein